jgi:hypothetical protein
MIWKYKDDRTDFWAEASRKVSIWKTEKKMEECCPTETDFWEVCYEECELPWVQVEKLSLVSTVRVCYSNATCLVICEIWGQNGGQDVEVLPLSTYGVTIQNNSVVAWLVVSLVT